MSSPTYIVIVTSGACHHCKSYKERMEANLLSKINTYSSQLKASGAGGIEIVKIHLPDSSQSLLTINNYHQKLLDYIHWFPTFFLFSGRSWENKSGPLEGDVFNGKKVNNKWEPIRPNEPGFYKFSPDGILNWIKEELSNNPIFIQKGSQMNAGFQTAGRSTYGNSPSQFAVLPSPISSYGNRQPNVRPIQFGAEISEGNTAPDRGW